MRISIRTYFTQYYGILLAFVALVLHLFAPVFPYNTIDIFYRNSLFVLVKWILIPFHWIPIPSIFIVSIACIYFIVRRFRKGRREGIFSIINLTGLLIALFYLTWAYNYSGRSIRSQLIHTIPQEVDSHYLLHLYQDITDQMTQIRILLPDTLRLSYSIDTLADIILPEEKRWLSHFGYPTQIPAKVKYLPKGSLLRLKTAGFYFPIGGEGYIDKGLHPIVIPHVLSHELAHNFGVTDEGEANFIAYRTCISSHDPIIQYAGYLDFWQYLAYNMQKLSPKLYQEKRALLHPLLVSDLRQIRETHNRYPDIFPALRDKVYDQYLKSQGVSSGLQSYSEVILLEIAYRYQQLPESSIEQPH